MQSLLTTMYGLIFALLIGWIVFRSLWRKWKNCSSKPRRRPSRSPQWYLLRVGATSVVAFVIAIVVSDGPAAFLWIVLWVAFYWLWRLWDRWSGKDIVTAADEPIPLVVVPTPQPLPVVVTPRPLWRRALRRTAKLAAGAVVFIVVMVAVMFLCLGYYKRQARAERNKVQIGMTVDEVLSRVHGGCVRAHAVLPVNMSDEGLVHYASFTERPDGTFGALGAPRLTEEEAVALMKKKMTDGYEWRWRYTFVNETPQHFSFTVTFGRDGRVKDVTDVWGWD